MLSSTDRRGSERNPALLIGRELFRTPADQPQVALDPRRIGRHVLKARLIGSSVPLLASPSITVRRAESHRLAFLLTTSSVMPAGKALLASAFRLVGNHIDSVRRGLVAVRLRNDPESCQ